MFSSCCNKDSAIVFTTGRLPDVNPPWNWSGYKRQQMQPGPTIQRLFRSTEELEIINFGHPSYDWTRPSHAELSDPGAIELLFDVSTHSLEIRAVQSPKCIVWYAVDCTHFSTMTYRNGTFHFILRTRHKLWYDKVLKYEYIIASGCTTYIIKRIVPELKLYVT
jgi:hypothetical protein